MASLMNPLLHYDPDDPYPETDGQPMAENTEQYEWIVKIKENLEILFADREDVFIAGDLLWYPVPDRQITGPLAPDVLVAFGRPKGRRGSYKQWEEGNQAPQVVFEIRSPSNSAQEMVGKRDFYDRYGVEEYYVYDPDRHRLEVWLRQGEHLQAMSHVKAWRSPQLGILFELKPEALKIYYPDGRPFLSSIALAQQMQQETARADQEAARADQAQQQAEQATQQLLEEQQRVQRLTEQLRTLGVTPNQTDL